MRLALELARCILILNVLLGQTQDTGVRYPFMQGFIWHFLDIVDTFVSPMKQNLIVTFHGMRLQCLQRWRERTWQAWMAVRCFLQVAQAFSQLIWTKFQETGAEQRKGIWQDIGKQFDKGLYMLICQIDGRGKRWNQILWPILRRLHHSVYTLAAQFRWRCWFFQLPRAILDKRAAESAESPEIPLENASFRHDRWGMLTGVDGNPLLQFFSWGSHPHSRTLAEWEWHVLELYQRYHLLSRCTVERWRPSTVSTTGTRYRRYRLWFSWPVWQQLHTWPDLYCTLLPSLSCHWRSLTFGGHLAKYFCWLGGGFAVSKWKPMSGASS